MADVFWFVLPGLVAAALSFALTPLVARLAVRVGALDIPDCRKIHDKPVPRLGGLAVVAAIVVVLACGQWVSDGRWHLPPHLVGGVGLGVLPILLVSIVDDIRTVSARKKAAVHVLAAAIAVNLGISLGPIVHLFGTPLHIGWIAAPLSVLWIVGVTNAFNLIDGLDGLSTGLALIAALGMAAVFALVDQAGMAGVSLVLAGALLGFLPYNLHPARLFLGDTGATAIGFCLAAFALRGGATLSTGFAALLPVLILGLPIADTLIAMVRRSLHRNALHGGGVFKPDRNHIHHRLLALGVDHRTAVFVLHAAGLALAAAALVSIFLNTREAALMISALALAGLVGIQRLGYDEFAFIRRGTVLKMYELPVVRRGFFVVLVDIAVTFVAAYVAVGLKTDTWNLAPMQGQVLEIATMLAPVTISVFTWRGMYRGSWRVAGLQDLTRVLVAVAIAVPMGAILLSVLSAQAYAPSLFGIYGALCLVLTAAVRVSYVVLEHTALRSNNDGIPVLIYGAGRHGVAAVREVFQHPGSGVRPVGFIDDDWAKRQKITSGLPVFGTSRELDRALEVSGARGVLIASSHIPEARVERAADACRRRGGLLFRLDIRVERVAPHDVDSDFALAPEGSPSGSGVPEDREAPEPQLCAGAQRCPACRSTSVHRSKARNMYERVKKVRSQSRLYRCETCGWRGWLVPLEWVTDATLVPAVEPRRSGRTDDPIAGVLSRRAGGMR